MGSGLFAGDRYDEFYELDLTKTVIPDMELDALYEADPARAQGLIAERWSALRRDRVYGGEHGGAFTGGNERLRAPARWPGLCPLGQGRHLPQRPAFPHAGSK